MRWRHWIPASLVALAILATIPYGPALRERLYRLGSPRLLAEVAVAVDRPLAATPGRVAVGSEAVAVYRVDGLELLHTWTPERPCVSLAFEANAVTCGPATPLPAGVLCRAAEGPWEVLCTRDGLLVNGEPRELPEPARDLRIQREAVHIALGEGGLLTQRLDSGAEIFHLPGEAVAVGGTDRALVVAGGGQLRTYDMVPGRRWVVPGVGLVLLFAVPWALIPAWRRGRAAVLWLLGVGACVAWKLHSLQGIPIEAVHLLEFTLFGALVCRALAVGRAGPAVWIGTALLSLVLGCADEALQWWHPLRTGDIRDVWTDALAGAFGALAAWKALGWAGPGPSWRLVPRLAAVALLALAGFQHLVHGFGSLETVAGVGTWTSRGTDVAEARAALRDHGELPYADYLRRFGKHTAPSAHEVRGRLYRRDFWLARERLDITCGEQAILDHAFPGLTEGTPFAIAPATALACAEVDTTAYVSPISAAAFTRSGPVPYWIGVLLLALACGVAGRPRRGEASTPPAPGTGPPR